MSILSFVSILQTPLWLDHLFVMETSTPKVSFKVKRLDSRVKRLHLKKAMNNASKTLPIRFCISKESANVIITTNSSPLSLLVQLGFLATTVVIRTLSSKMRTNEQSITTMSRWNLKTNNFINIIGKSEISKFRVRVLERGVKARRMFIVRNWIEC